MDEILDSVEEILDDSSESSEELVERVVESAEEVISNVVENAEEVVANVVENGDVVMPDIARYFFSNECYQSLVHDRNYSDIPCVHLLSSKVIGYSFVVLMSLFVMVPQIMRILKYRSVEGIGLTSNLMLLVAVTSSIGYSYTKQFPISLWGENIAISAQTFLVVILILIYKRKRYASAILVLLLYGAGVGYMMSPFCPEVIHEYLQMAAVPLVVFSKFSQIFLNVKNNSCGQLSALMIFMLTIRAYGRLYTFMIETRDIYMIAVYAAAGILNTLLSLQILIFKCRREEQLVLFKKGV